MKNSNLTVIDLGILPRHYLYEAIHRRPLLLIICDLFTGRLSRYYLFLFKLPR